MTSERLFNSFNPPLQKIYPHLQKKFLDTLLILAVINTANWTNWYEMFTVKITADDRDINEIIVETVADQGFPKEGDGPW